jgi:hypothetical protein
MIVEPQERTEWRWALSDLRNHSSLVNNGERNVRGWQYHPSMGGGTAFKVVSTTALTSAAPALMNKAHRLAVEESDDSGGGSIAARSRRCQDLSSGPPFAHN